MTILGRQRINPELARLLEENPEVEHSFLIHVQQADDETERQLSDSGLVVRRRFRLTPSFAVQGPGAAALQLLDQNWVQRIEEDSIVHTMSPRRFS